MQYCPILSSGLRGHICLGETAVTIAVVSNLIDLICRCSLELLKSPLELVIPQ